MALIKCPDCGKEISSRAVSCPFCGNPDVGLSAEKAFNNGCDSDDAGKLADAIYWFRLASEKDDYRAMWRLYLIIQNDAPNEEIVELLLKAAKLGETNSMFTLGQVYGNGMYGVNVDNTQSANWFEAAAKLGDAEAQRVIGDYYLDGIGVDRDIDKGLDWLKKAADNGEPSAYISLGNFFAMQEHSPDYYTTGMFATAKHYLMLAANTGSDWAREKLELEYEQYEKLKVYYKQANIII